MKDCIIKEIAIAKIKHIKPACVMSEYGAGYMKGLKDTIDILNTITIADVQPVRRGKWDTHDVVKVLCSGKTLDGFCQCEACGDVFPLAYSEYNYCPNCGARMDGDTE